MLGEDEEFDFAAYFGDDVSELLPAGNEAAIMMFVMTTEIHRIIQNRIFSTFPPLMGNFRLF